MKTLFLITLIFLVMLPAGIIQAQSADEALSQIILYPGDVTGTGTGIGSIKLAVGEEMTITAKGVDKDGKEVNIWPTWKADKEFALTVVEGRSKTVVVKALKAGAPLFVTCIYKTDAGNIVKAEAMGSVKEK
jgi:hypothetical protein